MISLEEFKIRYNSVIQEYMITESEILEAYEVFKEDPFQFHENMFLQ